MSPTPPLVIRKHDPAQQRRVRWLLASAWLGSLLIAAALAGTFFARAPAVDHSLSLRRAAVNAENEALKTRIAVLERSDQVARAALAEVQQSLRERDEEVDGLRADLAFYARLAGGGKREGLAVHTFTAKSVRNSQAWNFTTTLTQNFRRGQDIKGRLTLAIEGVEGGKLTTLDWNALSQGQNKSGIEYSFKYFQQVSGTIMFPAGFSANRVIVRADGDGGSVEQEFSWKDAVKNEEGDDVSQ